MESKIEMYMVIALARKLGLTPKEFVDMYFDLKETRNYMEGMAEASAQKYMEEKKKAGDVTIDDIVKM